MRDTYSQKLHDESKWNEIFIILLINKLFLFNINYSKHNKNSQIQIFKLKFAPKTASVHQSYTT